MEKEGWSTTSQARVEDEEIFGELTEKENFNWII